MTTSVYFRFVNLGLLNYRTYLWGMAFVIGNLLLPQLCHLVPDGGKVLLPIYFFTLIAAYKFGLKVGLLTAILSPLCNNLLFGMPLSAVLPILLIKSSLLAIAASLIANHTGKVSLLNLVCVVLSYQLIGAIAEFFLTDSLPMAIQDLTLGIPGILVQIIGGWLLLKAFSTYE